MPTTKGVRSADGTKGRVCRQEEVTTRIGDAGMTIGRPRTHQTRPYVGGDVLPHERQSWHYPGLDLDLFVVMPTHIHAILVLTETEGPSAPAPRRYPPSEIIHGFKTFSARRINKCLGAQGNRVWQRNYYERIICNERELNAIREYIINNPTQWEADRERDEHGP